MKFDQKKIVPFVTGAGLTFAGIAAPYAASRFVPANLRKFVPLAAGLAGAGLVLMTKGEQTKNLGMGMASYGLLAGVSQFTKDASGSVATAGVKGMIASYVPQLAGAPSLGQVFQYNENAMPLLGTDYPSYNELGNEFQQDELMGVGTIDDTGMMM